MVGVGRSHVPVSAFLAAKASGSHDAHHAHGAAGAENGGKDESGHARPRPHHPHPHILPRKTHRSFGWVAAEHGFEDQDLTAEEVVVLYGVPQPVLCTYIRGELDDEESFKSLPLALSLVLFFAMMFVSHDEAVVVHGIEEAIDFDLEENSVFAFSAPGPMGHKSLNDINSYADFWSWLRLGLMPLLFADRKPISEEGGSIDQGPLNIDERRFFLWHNRKVGGLQIRQERSQYIDCPNPKLAFGRQCTSEARDLNTNVEIEEFDILGAPLVEDKNYTLWFRYLGPNDTLADLERRALDLEIGEDWMNPMTARIDLTFVLYSAPKDVLTLNRITFVFARSGHIWKRLTHRSIVMDPYRYRYTAIWDFLFFGQVTWIFLCETKEILQGVRDAKGKICQFLKNYMGMWNAVDWVSIIMAYVILVIVIFQFNMTVQVREQLVSLEDRQAACLETYSVRECDEGLAEFFEETLVCGNFVKTARQLCAFYPFIIMLRLFKAFAAQARLSVVTRTLSKASSGLAHFGIVVMAVFMIYAIIGTIVFGRELDSFTTILRAGVTLFRALMGDFDVEEMRVVGRGKTLLYFASFMVFIGFVMLDMVVAILMDTYAEVKMGLAGTETLIEQATEMARRATQNRRGQRMRLSKIWNILAAHYGEDNMQNESITEQLTIEKFQSIVPGLRTDQATMLLEEAANGYTRTNKIEPSLWDVMHMLAVISLSQHQFTAFCSSVEMKT
jgi:hypothetical protein